MRVIERKEDNSYESPLISMLHIRTREGDELLLHSGGPVTDLSQKSMLPSLGWHSLPFFEPYGEDAPTGSALRGNTPKDPSSAQLSSSATSRRALAYRGGIIQQH